MKERNSKKYWLVFIGIALAITIVIFCIWLPYRNKTKAPTKNDTSINYTETAKTALENNDYGTAVDNYEKAIEENPTKTENYVDKSAAEYAAGDKDAAISTVEEGLKQDPTNELLRARLEVLQKNNFNQVTGEAKP